MPQKIESLTVNEVCARFRCSRNTVYRLLAKGELQSFRLKRSIRILEESLHEFVARSLTPPPPKPRRQTIAMRTPLKDHLA